MAGEVSIGDVSAKVTSVAYGSDPEVGIWVVITIEGPQDGVNALMFQYAAIGFRCSSRQLNGPVWQATCTGTPSQNDTGVDEITDQWEFDTTGVQESIYSNPKVLAAVGWDDESLSIAAQEIEESANDHLTISQFMEKYGITGTPTAGQAFAIELYALRIRGQQATEVERVTLRRNRTIPQSDARRATQDAVPKVYTTSALIAVFGVPASIAALLPSTPATLDIYSTWAWKKQRDSSVIIPQIGKAQETREWVFASWANATYTLIT